VNHIRQSPELFRRFADNDAAERYLTAMSLPDTYGDELCLHSLADAFAIKIKVFTPQYGTLLFNESESTTIMIAYNGRDHYDVILHRANSNSISSPLPCESPFDDPPMELEVYNEQPLKRSDTIILLSINAASWECHSQSLLSSGADVIAVQEARVSEVGAIQQNKILAAWDPPWHAIWGKPPAPPKNKFKMHAKRAAGKTTYGGVGILSKKIIPLISTGRESHAAQALFESTRWVSSAIPLGSNGALSRRFVHVCSFLLRSGK
jgi:hypothetical protein